MLWGRRRGPVLQLAADLAEPRAQALPEAPAVPAAPAAGTLARPPLPPPLPAQLRVVGGARQASARSLTPQSPLPLFGRDRPTKQRAAERLSRDSSIWPARGPLAMARDVVSGEGPGGLLRDVPAALRSLQERLTPLVDRAVAGPLRWVQGMRPSQLRLPVARAAAAPPPAEGEMADVVRAATAAAMAAAAAVAAAPSSAPLADGRQPPMPPGPASSAADPPSTSGAPPAAAVPPVFIPWQAATSAGPRSKPVVPRRRWYNEGDEPGEPAAANLQGVHSDEELRSLMVQAGGRLLVVEFGAPWCDHCRTMVPQFVRLSEEFPQALFVLADVDRLTDTARDIRYTPTFGFYVRGRKVDEVTGSNLQQLRDHMWLHAAPQGK